MADWLDAAQALVEGTTRKIPHDCGPGDCLQINHKRDGFSAFCHRCGESFWSRRPQETLREKLDRLARVRSREVAVERAPGLPKPIIAEPSAWPVAARVWLYKAALSNVDIERLGIYWNPRTERVVIPIRNDAGDLIYWQARTLDPTNPKKYLNPHVSKTSLLAKYGDGAAIVLTEDILSAYRVSRCGVAGWCLMGTKLNDHTATELIRSGKPVIVWLDPDKAGQTARRSIIRDLRDYGVPARKVVSAKDPKLLSRAQIDAALEIV